MTDSATVRVKPLPAPPGDVERVFEARRAIPLVPDSEEDCCLRIVDRIGVSGRDEARRWLTLLRGLGLVRESDRGFHRTRDEVDRGDLPEAFLAGVFGAREVLAALDAADRPLEGESVFEAFEDHVPNWERNRNPRTWREDWRDRTARLLDWLVLLGLAERTADGYVRE